MAETTQILERTEAGTVIKTGNNGQRTVLPHVLPILPIRNIVVFPGTVMPLNVGRSKSKSLLDEVMPGEKIIGVCTQKSPDIEDPQYPDLYTVGVACVILKLFKLPDGNQSIIVHGLTRFRLLSIEQNDPFTTGRIEVLEDVLTPGPSLDARSRWSWSRAGRRSSWPGSMAGPTTRSPGTPTWRWAPRWPGRDGLMRRSRGSSGRRGP